MDYKGALQNSDSNAPFDISNILGKRNYVKYTV